MKSRLVFVLIVLGLSACEAQDPPTGIPRCEPEGELLVERKLKTGFKHLFDGDSQQAREVFKELLEQEPEHPEALLGMKHSEGVATKRRGVSSESRFTIANRLIPAPMSVNSERFRYEYEWEGQRIRNRLAGLNEEDHNEPDRKRPYSIRRDQVGAAIASDDLAHVQRAVDTIVFRDSQTNTVSEFFYLSAMKGHSTHFLIDPSGRIFQSLDLALEAHHCSVPNVSRRSISITVVNPMQISKKSMLDRQKSAPLERHGSKVSHWEYTPTQRRSLNQLVAGLLALVPQIRRDVPEDTLGRVLSTSVSKPNDAKGLLGHFHIDSNVLDPTVAFPWVELKRYLSVSMEP